MSNVTAHVWDMPIYKYRLASGKLKRRVCGLEFHRILTEEILAFTPVRGARARGKLRLVIERPSPIPDLDGWQSAALSGTHAFRTAVPVPSSTPFPIVNVWKPS